uniref:Uncharacterized protein n=1 Tax=Amphiprion ocellaris TaxID=80972 RepID=A0A3Q1BG28_AMPOC
MTWSSSAKCKEAYLQARGAAPLRGGEVIKSSGTLSLPGFGRRPVNQNFLNLRRKYHRHHCLYRRCLPLHSRVPFP